MRKIPLHPPNKAPEPEPSFVQKLTSFFYGGTKKEPQQQPQQHQQQQQQFGPQPRPHLPPVGHSVPSAPPAPPTEEVIATGQVQGEEGGGETLVRGQVFNIPNHPQQGHFQQRPQPRPRRPRPLRPEDLPLVVYDSPPPPPPPPPQQQPLPQPVQSAFVTETLVPGPIIKQIPAPDLSKVGI